MPSSVVETTGPPPTAFGVAARTELPATGNGTWILVVMAVTLIVTGVLLVIRTKQIRKEGR